MRMACKTNLRGESVAFTAISLGIALSVAIPTALLRATEENWRPPQAAHFGANDFSVYCVHDGKNASFVIAFHGDFGSKSTHTSNYRKRTWHEATTLTLKTKTLEKKVALSREHTAPDKLTLAGNAYDLTKGRVFLLSDDGESINQLAIHPPAIQERADADALAKKIAMMKSESPQSQAGQARRRDAGTGAEGSR